MASRGFLMKCTPPTGQSTHHTWSLYRHETTVWFGSTMHSCLAALLSINSLATSCMTLHPRNVKGGSTVKHRLDVVRQFGLPPKHGHTGMSQYLASSMREGSANAALTATAKDGRRAKLGRRKMGNLIQKAPSDNSSSVSTVLGPTYRVSSL
jgi:hypothetical protein